MVLKFIGEKCGNNVCHSQLPHVWSSFYKPPLRKPLCFSWILQIPLLLYCPEVEKPALRNSRQDCLSRKTGILVAVMGQPCGRGEVSALIIAVVANEKEKDVFFPFEHSLSNMRWDWEHDEGISKAF